MSRFFILTSFLILLVLANGHSYAQNGLFYAVNSYFHKISGNDSKNLKPYLEVKAGIEIDMVPVKGGSFFMGCKPQGELKCSEDETPSHKVTVDDFYLSKYEITNEQFCAFLNNLGVGRSAVHGGHQLIDYSKITSQLSFENGVFKPLKGFEHYPVVEVSWFGAAAFCKWAGGRLPTEAEWEYAARGGKDSKGYDYSGSNNLDEVAWYFDNSKSGKSSNFYESHGTFRVGQKKPNELGLYDMSGNVYEWCQDVYERDYYGYSPENNPQGPASGNSRVLRGGSWGDELKSCRLTFRVSVGEYTNYFMYGFRLCKD